MTVSDVRFSVVISVGREELLDKIERSIRNNSFIEKKIEIILIRGKELPGEKRNKGAQIAKGDFLVFLDDDVEIDSGYFQALDRILVQEKADILGGPNCGGQSVNKIQKMIEIAFSRKVGFGKGAKRFSKINRIMEGNEDVLTACNLCINRVVFLKERGFKETLFPGEEVELVRRLREQGYKLIYHPEIMVIHHRRSTLKDLWKQVFNYGKGRMALFLVGGFNMRDFTYLFPLCLVLYGLLIPIATISFPFLLIGAAMYVLVLIICCLFEWRSGRVKGKEIVTLLIVFAVMHVSYGCGMLMRLVSRRG